MSEVDDKIRKLLLTNADRAIELVYKHYYSSLCQYALRFFDDEDEAEDTVQKTLVRLWERLDQLQKVSAIHTYLYRSVHNSCLNTLRDNKFKKQNLTDEDIELLELANEMTEVHNDRYEQMTKAINELPPQCKKILELNRIDGFTYKEIAEQLNISYRTVDTHLTNAMRLLRQKLKPVMVCVLLILITIP